MELSDRDETICRIQKSSEIEKLKNEERISDLERAKDILLDAKVNLQNEVADSGKRQMLLQEQIESVNGQLKDREDRYEMEVNGLRQQIVSYHWIIRSIDHEPSEIMFVSRQCNFNRRICSNHIC